MEQKLSNVPLSAEKTYKEYIAELSTESALLGKRAISSHLSSSLRKLGHPERAIRSLEKCQQQTGGYFLQWCDCGHSNNIHPLKHWCNNRTCPPCAEKRKKRLRNLYLTSLLKLEQNNKLSLKFLTISPQNYTNLKEGLKDIRKNFRKFLRLKYIKKRMFGSIYIIEAKQQWAGQQVYHKETGMYLYTVKQTSWNIHIHAIVYGKFLRNQIKGKCNQCGNRNIKFNHQTKKYRCASPNCLSHDVVAEKNSKLTREWLKCTNNQPVNMHVTRQANKQTGRNNPRWTLNYMLKYISTGKEDFENEDAEAEYISSTYHTRLIETTGMFKDYPWEKQHPHCEICKTQIQFMTCYDVEKAISHAQRIEAVRRSLLEKAHQQLFQWLQIQSEIVQSKQLLTYYI